jgi:uncharacterized protein
MKNILLNNDLNGLEQALTAHPELSNEGIAYDEVNTTKAHPLHRICDGVFAGKYSDEEAVEIAKIFLKHGANVDGNILMVKQDTPLVAAASLHADLVAILYMTHGAGISHQGCHGGTALHWAAWCGRPVLVERLILAGAEINKRCIDFMATPLFWAIHGSHQADNIMEDYMLCVKLLIQAGADKNIPNVEGKTIFDLLQDGHVELLQLLK